MAGQFEIGSKHLEYKKLASTTIEEIKSNNYNEIVKTLTKKSFCSTPSKEAVYDDYLAAVVSIEEIAKVVPQAASMMVDQMIAQEIITRFGTSETKAACTQDAIYSVLCSEPGLSTISSIKTTAIKSATGWNLQGKKSITAEQLNSDKFIVFAKDEQEKVRIFLLPKSKLNVNQVNKTIAGSNVTLNQLSIEQEVPENACIAILTEEYEKVQCIARTYIAAVSLGIAHTAIVSSITTSKEVKGAENLAISNTQSIQFTLADMYAELDAAKMLTYLSANLIDNNKANIKYATMAKVQATDSAASVSMQALQIIGNLGYIANTDFADAIQVAINQQIKGGTNRVQKNQIYQHMLAKK
jgi:alkylation response protein AidB-like acyl-CoA dehydrogenase